MGYKDFVMDSKIKNIDQQLFASLRNLEYLLLKSKPLYSNVAVISPTLKGNESEPINQIIVEPVRGNAAIKLSSSCYQDLFIKNELSQKSSRRTVGAIWIDGRMKKDIYETVCEINSLKNSIEQYVISNHSTRSQRFEALREILAGVMPLHLYRQIRVFYNESVTAVRFSWQQKDVVTIPDKKELVDKVLSDSEYSLNEDYRIALRLLASKIDSIPSEDLRLRRQVKVQPVSNLKINGSTKTVTAPMPIIFLQNKPIDIKGIRSFDSKDRSLKASRSDKSEIEVVGTFSGLTIEKRLS